MIKSSKKIVPLHFVITPKKQIAIVTEINTHDNSDLPPEVSIEIIGENLFMEKKAWWDCEDLLVIDSLPNLMARLVAHNLGLNGRREEVDKYFKI